MKMKDEWQQLNQDAFIVLCISTLLSEDTIWSAKDFPTIFLLSVETPLNSFSSFSAFTSNTDDF